MATSALPTPRQRGPLARLLRQHEQLEQLIAARHSHGLPAKQQWLAMIAIEDRLATEHPRAHAHWIAIWALRRPTAAHTPGKTSTLCPLCTTAVHNHPATPSPKNPRVAGTAHHTKATAAQRR